MIKNYQELKEAFESFVDNNDEFPSAVDVVISKGVDEYALICTGIERKDFEILCAEFWDYLEDGDK